MGNFMVIKLVTHMTGSSSTVLVARTKSLPSNMAVQVEPGMVLRYEESFYIGQFPGDKHQSTYLITAAKAW